MMVSDCSKARVQAEGRSHMVAPLSLVRLEQVVRLEQDTTGRRLSRLAEVCTRPASPYLLRHGENWGRAVMSHCREMCVQGGICDLF